MILGILRTNILITRKQHILITQRRSRRHLSEEANLDRLSNPYSLSLLYEYLSRVFTPILTIQAGNSVCFGMMAFFERLQGGHKVMSSGDAGCDQAFSQPGCHGAFDDGGDGVHWADDAGLELRGDVELDLAEEVFGGAETTDDEDVLQYTISTQSPHCQSQNIPVIDDSQPE